ncbi:MAG: cytochrome c, partial [Alphaproteobacteria bacterium]
RQNPMRKVIIAVILGALAIGAYAIFTANSDKSGRQQSAADTKAPDANTVEKKAAETKTSDTAASSAPAPDAKTADTAAPAAKPADSKAADTNTAANPAAAPVDDLTRFDGKPYKVYPDGKVNFATYRGYNMYSSICFVCHGPAGLGSSFAPALVESLKVLSYEDFVGTVMNGRENITSVSNNVMPSFGTNPTIVKYIDSLYAYLKGRSDGAIGRGELEFAGPKDE